MALRESKARCDVREASKEQQRMNACVRRRTTRFARTHIPLSLATLASCSLGLLACSSPSDPAKPAARVEQKVIFGPDDFRDVGPLSPGDSMYRRVRATASMFKDTVEAAVTCDEASDTCELPTQPFDSVTFVLGSYQSVTYKVLPLCAGEQFGGQPQGSTCTAFLIDTDLMVTAGHCVDDPSDCERMKLVFGFVANDSAGQDVNTTVPMNDVYSCSEVVANVHQGSEIGDEDFAIIRLNRPVTDRVPVAMRTFGAIADGASVNMVSGYHGLALKISDNAVVMNNPLSEPRFEVNLDAGKGSSGSPVFAESGLVEGILVSGPVSKNYEIAAATDGTECARAIRCDDVDGCNTQDPDEGELDWTRVSRISSVVDALEGRSCFDRRLSPNETDVDCGGPKCAPCMPDQLCNEDADCGLPGGLRPACWQSACGDDGRCIKDVSACECGSDTDCDDGIACTINHCGGSNSCWYEKTDECVACTTDADCDDPELASCVVPRCSEQNVCNNDLSACECTEENAIDLGAPGNTVTVPNDTCLRVRDAYPFWWGEARTMQLQPRTPGAYPVGYTWSNDCSGSAGAGTFDQAWQSGYLPGVSSSCATLIRLDGDGTESVSLTYFGN